MVAASALFSWQAATAQVRQPVPTGQVPKSYTGVQSAQPAVVKPKPTGQIAPEVPGQPVGTLYQPAQPTTQKASDVQNLGFENYSAPASQAGMVPKVNTSQDPRLMPERYQPDAGQSQPVVTSEQVQQLIQPVQTQQVMPGQTQGAQTQPGQMQQAGNTVVAQPAPGTATMQTTTRTQATQTSPQPGTVNRQVPAGQPAQSNTSKTIP